MCCLAAHISTEHVTVNYVQRQAICLHIMTWQFLDVPLQYYPLASCYLAVISVNVLSCIVRYSKEAVYVVCCKLACNYLRPLLLF
jgi:hypothetical protein